MKRKILTKASQEEEPETIHDRAITLWLASFSHNTLQELLKYWLYEPVNEVKPQAKTAEGSSLHSLSIFCYIVANLETVIHWDTQ